MLPEQIEKLREQYTGRYVEISVQRPDLARFQGQLGQIQTVNLNGRALVQFDGANRAWYDIDLDFLRVVEKPQPEKEPAVKPPAAQ